MTHHDFLQEILANPDDDGPRLVYADWLDEHGDPLQAEFIRAQCELARLSPDDPRHQEARTREFLVTLKYRRRWREHLPPWTEPLRIWARRGFAAVVYCSIPSFIKKAARLLTVAPIQHLRLSRGEPYLQKLLHFPQIKRIRTIEIECCNFTANSYRLLADCRGLTRLVALRIHGANNLDRRAAEILVHSPWLSDLHTLECVTADPDVTDLLSTRFRSDFAV